MQPVMFDERTWLAWLVKIRVLILTLLLGVELVVARLSATSLPVGLFVFSVLLWFGVSLFYVLLLSIWQEYKLQAALQVITDLLFVTLIVHVTGGVDSSLNFLYPLVIIVACILLPRVWAYITAGLAFALFGAIVELNFYGAIPSYSTSRPALTALQVIVVMNLLAYLAVAYLAGHLTSKLRQVGIQLQDTSGALEDLQVLHQHVVEAITGGLITTDLTGKITLINPAALQLLRRSEQELLGTPISQWFVDPLPSVQNERAHSEVRSLLPDDFQKTFRVIVSAMRVSDEDKGFVYTFDDLTEVRRLEREVRIQDRLAAVGRLAAAIAHEIRNPLASIAGSVSMLSDVPDLNEEHRKLLQIVTRESGRLNNIITDFLAYSRGKQYHFAVTNLVPLIEDTLTLLGHRLVAENSGIKIERNIPASRAIVLADGDKIKQVFWNFCENAVRAMKEGGTLRVSLEAVGDDWQVSFSDTGPGMSPQQREKIFEPFQSGFEGGTGLGLAIVYQIVQAHDGNVWARSQLGKGTTFVLRLRRLGAEKAVLDAQASVEFAAVAGGGRG
ncbi:MAG TPA: ATP-binding protein [Terriglobales bacterium]|jgi:two-component system, NtrC family, sensor histidine kinase PilS|nr:ATP-binding protein [Terriglobales bacterium]